MTENMEQSLANNIVGIDQVVIIDSGVYGHLFGEHEFDTNDDIIVIVGTLDRPIKLKDVLGAYHKIQEQLDKVSNSKWSGKSYFYEGLKYSEKNQSYYIVWGS